VQRLPLAPAAQVTETGLDVASRLPLEPENNRSSYVPAVPGIVSEHEPDALPLPRARCEHVAS
jgi:hypothetical protein